MVKLRLGWVMVAGAMLAGCGHTAPVGERAMTAYGAHNYQAALPLLKEWVKTPEVMGNEKLRFAVVGYIYDSETKLGMKTADSAPAVAVPAVAPATTLTAAAAVDRVKSLAPAVAPRLPHPPMKAGEVRSMAIKELGNFPFDPDVDADVPADVKALSGHTLRLRGFMLPLTQADHVTLFALVPSLFNCCFGQPPGVEHMITCHIPTDKALEYVTEEISVEGTLKVNVVREDGYTNSIFEMDVKSVKPVE